MINSWSEVVLNKAINQPLFFLKKHNLFLPWMTGLEQPYLEHANDGGGQGRVVLGAEKNGVVQHKTHEARGQKLHEKHRILPSFKLHCLQERQRHVKRLCSAESLIAHLYW